MNHNKKHTLKKKRVLIINIIKKTCKIGEIKKIILTITHKKTTTITLMLW